MAAPGSELTGLKAGDISGGTTKLNWHNENNFGIHS